MWSNLRIGLQYIYPILFFSVTFAFLIEEDLSLGNKILWYTIVCNPIMVGGLFLYNGNWFVQNKQEGKGYFISVLACLAISLLAPFVLLFSFPFYTLYWFYLHYPILSYIEIPLFVITIVLCAVFFYNWHQKIVVPKVRALFFTLCPVLCVFSLVIRVWGYISFYSELHDTWIGVCFVGYMAYCVGLLREVYQKRKNVEFYLTIPRYKFLFFLRPFYKNTYIIDKELSTLLNIPLVEVADPTTWDGNTSFSGYQLFLPSKNWKNEISYYISRAHLVFCYVGDSDGVMWEMFEHKDNIHKYIYYVDQIKNLQVVLRRVSKEKYKQGIVFRALSNLSLLNVSRQTSKVFFVIRDNTILYTSSLPILIEYLKTNTNTEHGLKKLEIEPEEINKNHSTKHVYLGKDVIRFIGIFLHQASILSKVFLAYLIRPIAYLIRPIAFLLGLIMLGGGGVSLYYGFLNIISIFWLEISIEDTLSNKLRFDVLDIILGWVCIAIGWSILHTLINKQTNKN